MAIVGERVPLEKNVLAGMAALLDDVDRWRQKQVRGAIARVVQIDGAGGSQGFSAAPGAALAVNEHGEVIGSVWGGCVEQAVVAEALSVIRLGRPKLVSFGYSDEQAFSVGLTCGGTVHVFLEPLDW